MVPRRVVAAFLVVGAVGWPVPEASGDGSALAVAELEMPEVDPGAKPEAEAEAEGVRLVKRRAVPGLSVMFSWSSWGSRNEICPDHRRSHYESL